MWAAFWSGAFLVAGFSPQKGMFYEEQAGCRCGKRRHGLVCWILLFWDRGWCSYHGTHTRAVRVWKGTIPGLMDVCWDMGGSLGRCMAGWCGVVVATTNKWTRQPLYITYVRWCWRGREEIASKHSVPYANNTCLNGISCPIPHLDLVASFTSKWRCQNITPIL